MRRILFGVLAVAGVAAAALAPQTEPDAREVAYRPVTSSVLVCPQMTGAGQATNVLGAVVTGPAAGAGIGRPVADLLQRLRRPAAGARASRWRCAR